MTGTKFADFSRKCVLDVRASTLMMPKKWPNA